MDTKQLPSSFGYGFICEVKMEKTQNQTCDLLFRKHLRILVRFKCFLYQMCWKQEFESCFKTSEISRSFSNQTLLGLFDCEEHLALREQPCYLKIQENA